MSGGRYDYSDAGLDSFLSRSIDDVSQVNLSAPGPPNNAIAFDRSSVTGPLGDTLRVGKIYIDGVKGRVSFFDDTGNEYMRQGELDD